MLFKLSNALGVFTQLMSIILSEMEGFAMTFWMVFSETRGEHFETLQRVFDRLRKHGLRLKLSVSF